MKNYPVIKTEDGADISTANFRKFQLVVRAKNHKLREKMIDLLTGVKNDGKHAGDGLTVTDIYIKLRLEQSVASQHLAILRRAGLVKTLRDGKFIYYSLNSPAIERYENTVSEICQEMGRDFDQNHAGEFCRAMGHELRGDILQFILDNDEINVNKIYNTLNLEQSITSQHLRILRLAGICTTDRAGKFIYYTVQYKLAQRIESIIRRYFASDGKFAFDLFANIDNAGSKKYSITAMRKDDDVQIISVFVNNTEMKPNAQLLEKIKAQAATIFTNRRTSAKNA